MKTIAQEWASFEADVMPQGAHATQRQEMRRAFYAGFFVALNGMRGIADESGDDEDLGAAMIESLHQECVRFSLDVKAGRA